MSQADFAQGMTAPKVRRGVADGTAAQPSEHSDARRALGAGNWLQNQTRPDLSVQVNLGQQRMGNPSVDDV
eukprot:11218054-Lingulodinium_polyedra.AAC.1